MTIQELRIIFMGTPQFAVESLRSLVEGGYNIIGVVTMPDKPVGRHGSVLQASPVKEYAVAHGIPVLQPDNLKAPQFLDQLRQLRADLQIVVAFRMLPQAVWDMPPMGTFNLHASLLPQYRGAAPINWAVINGETETGITTFFLRHEIDTGMIIQQVRVPINPDDNAGDLHDRLMMLGGKLVVETAHNILTGNIHPIEQSQVMPSSQLKPAPKIFHETCMIRWDQPSKGVYNFIRGLAPYPAAWTSINGQQLKIFQATMTDIPCADLSPGTLVCDGRNYLYVATSDTMLSLDQVQLAGKKRMPIKNFLQGFHQAEGMQIR